MVSEMDLKAVCLKYEKKVIDLRREFHMHPELSFQEIRTAQRVREELDKAGIAWENVPDTHSVIGIVKGAHPGKTIALRADMDGLPMQEESEPPYKSQTEGVDACLRT
jgi:Metal-dependent amidase/aminoacylase/carboxypeptidase